MTHLTSQSHTHYPSTRSLWIGLLGGPVIWSIYFIGGYAISEASCYSDFLNGTLLGLNALVTTLLMMTVLAFLMILYVGWAAFRNWGHLQGQKSGSESANQTENNADFMSLVGIMLSGLAAFLTLAIGLATPFLPMCN